MVLEWMLIQMLASPQIGRATDWLAPTADCAFLAVADIDDDGYGDLITLTANGHANLAYSVHGWKSAAPRSAFRTSSEQLIGAAGGEFDLQHAGDEVALIYSDRVVLWGADDAGKLAQIRETPASVGATFASVLALADGVVVIDTASEAWTFGGEGFANRGRSDASEALCADGPQYGPEAKPLCTTLGDVTGDGVPDCLTLFEATKPSRHRIVRMAPGLNATSSDQDDDGLSDADEMDCGSDPMNRDTDADGLLDGWEVHGLPRGIVGLDTPLSPVHQDVIVSVSPYVDPGRAKVEKEINKSKSLYANLPTPNPDGTTGIAIHYRFNDEVPEERQGSWQKVGPSELKKSERGILHWMQVTPGGGGQSQQLGTMGQSGNNWAAFAHEMGHQLGLSHTGDSSPAWCPIYSSIMNYAYDYTYDGSGSRIHFSDGRFDSIELLETALVEHLPFPIDDVQFLSKRPYYFPIRDDGRGGTLIDWNQNGRFDEEPVVADINYGGSTNAGTRRWQDRVGSQSMLAYVGSTCLLLSIDLDHAQVSLRNYLGHEKWSEHRIIPDASTSHDMLLMGGTQWGWVMVRQDDGWHVARVNADSIQSLAPLSDLPPVDLGGVAVGDRALIIARQEDDRLEAFWLDWNEAPLLTSIGDLAVTSQVAPGLAVNPVDLSIALVTAATNPKGTKHSMRVTTLTIEGDRVLEGGTLWSRGENSGHQCTTRPAPGFTEQGELLIFHTGKPRSNGQMHVYRTRRIGNTNLDHGWLSSLMYDEWTRTLVGPGFALGPQGAIYSFRWDSGRNGKLETRTLGLAHNALGIDTKPMRDFNDAAKMSQWGIRRSILYMDRD